MGISLPPIDHIFHGDIAGQVLLKSGHPAGEEEDGVLLIGVQAIGLQILHRHAAYTLKRRNQFQGDGSGGTADFLMVDLDRERELVILEVDGI